MKELKPQFVAIYSAGTFNRERAWAYVMSREHAVRVGAANGWNNSVIYTLAEMETPSAQYFMKKNPQIGATLEEYERVANAFADVINQKEAK